MKTSTEQFQIRTGWREEAVDAVIRSTCPRDCYDSCGLVVALRDGVIQSVRGDPAHPVSRGTLCAKCAIAYNGAVRDPSARLTRPLRRIGVKGEGQFAPLSWDEAIATVARRLRGVCDAAGAEAIVNAHYTGARSLLARDFPMRFFNRLGATEVVPETICYIAGQIALECVYGTAFVGFDPRTAKDSASILVWGANPSSTAPHAHMHWLRDTQAKIIVVDPVRHATARMAALHLQPFPGSDAALAFSLMHVLRREGLIDREFVARYTLGWDELETLIAVATPEYGEAMTGVPKADIERAARLYGAGPALLWMGMGLSRQPKGGNIVRAVSLLPAVSGNIGKPGAGFLYINGAGRWGLDLDGLMGPQLRAAPQGALSHMDLAGHLQSSAGALICWNINIAATNPQQARLRRALAREDLFTVVIDLFQTDTADYADIVLPAASFLEFDDLIYSYFHLTLGAQVKAQDPPGEALPNQEIFRKLARAMGFVEPELYESDRTILASLLQQTDTGLTFEDLARRGSIYVAPQPVMQFEDLRFPTPSGRVELASDCANARGLPRLPSLEVDPRPPEGHLRLLSPAGHWLSSSAFGNDPKIVRRLGPPAIHIHPDDALSLGLSDDSYAVAANDSGRLIVKVVVSDIIPRGAALSYKARWLKSDPSRANVNVLNGGAKSDMGAGSAVHGVEITLTPADPDDRRALDACAQPPRLTANAM